MKNGILVNGEFLELMPGSSLQLTLRNPIFADNNIIPGSFSMPLTIPFGESSTKNSRILKNLDIVENAERLREIPADYYYDGIWMMTGKLVIGKPAKLGRELSVHFQFGLSNLESVKKLSLKEVMDEEIVLNNNTTYVKEVELEPKDPMDTSLQITVNKKPFSGNSIAALVTAINNDTSEPRAIATDHTTYFSLKPFSNQTDIETPFTVDGLGSEWNVTPNDEDWNGPIKTALDAYVTEPYPNNKFRLPKLMNKAQFETGYQLIDTGFINDNKDGHIAEQNKSAPETAGGIVNLNPFESRVYSSIAPYVMLKYVLDKIATHYGISYEGDFYTQEWLDDALIYTPNSITVNVPFIGQYPYFFFRQSFNLAEFVPDISVADFFKALQTRFNLAIYYKEKTKHLVIRKRSSLIADLDYKDISSKCSGLEPEDIGVDGLRLSSDPDGDDELSPVENLIIGTEVESEIKTICFGLSEGIDWHTGDAIPEVRQPFTSKPYKHLRLFFYNGIQPEPDEEFDYARASVNHEEFDLTFAGENGLYLKEWKDWVRFLMRRKRADLTTRLEVSDILSLDWEKKVMIDRSIFFFDSIEVSLGMNIKPSKTSVFKV